MNVRLIGVAVLLGVAFIAGWKGAAWRADAKLLKAVEARQKAATRAQELNDRVTALREEKATLAEQAAAKREVETRVVEREVEKEVIKYVQVNDNTDCRLDTDWVRIHNTAAIGRVSDDTATPGEDTPETGTASRAEALEAVTVNYGIYHRVANRLRACQGYVRAVQSARE